MQIAETLCLSLASSASHATRTSLTHDPRPTLLRQTTATLKSDHVHHPPTTLVVLLHAQPTSFAIYELRETCFDVFLCCHNSTAAQRPFASTRAAYRNERD